MLEDLRDIAPTDRQEAIERQLKLLDSAIDRAWPDTEDRKSAAVRDRQGIGDDLV